MYNEEPNIGQLNIQEPPLLPELRLSGSTETHYQTTNYPHTPNPNIYTYTNNNNNSLPAGVAYLNIVDSQLCILLLRLELKLHVEHGYPGVLKVLPLHLETRIGESLLEGHARHQPRLLPETRQRKEKRKTGKKRRRKKKKKDRQKKKKGGKKKESK